MPADDVAAAARFVDKAQFNVRLFDLFDGLVEGVDGAPGRPVEPHFAPGLREGNGDRILVRVQADILDFLHGCLVSL